MIRTSARRLSTAAKPPTVTQKKLIIDGKLVDAVSGKTFNTINPATGSVICSIAEGGKEDIDLAVQAARKAFDHGPWPRMSGRERGKILTKFADLIEKHSDELAGLETLDNGKPLAMSKAADLPLTIDHYRYYGGYADKVYGKTIPINDGAFFAYTLHEPIGVIGQVTPWNFPLLMMAWKTAPALAMGNTIVLKASEQTPLTALRAGQLALEAGLPPGVLNVVPGLGSVAGEALSRHHDVDKIAFTGSTAVGHKIMEGAAQSNLKKVSLELGGKSAMIVCADADIDQAVESAYFGLFFNQGQVCCAASRLYVHESIYDQFVAKSVAKAKARKVGDPFTDVEQGPQVSEAQYKKVLSYIDIGQREGAKMVTGGKGVGNTGYFVEPTVFTDVTENMRIAKEEIFGPVMSIMKFKTNEEVVQRANKSEYGLAAGVWSKNIDTVNQISRNLRAGTIWVNCWNNFDSAIPFGGYKKSGFGKDKSTYALDAYCEVKTVQMPIFNSNWR